VDEGAGDSVESGADRTRVAQVGGCGLRSTSGEGRQALGVAGHRPDRTAGTQQCLDDGAALGAGGSEDGDGLSS
jgi:hypothetical protein